MGTMNRIFDGVHTRHLVNTIERFVFGGDSSNLFSILIPR